MKSKTFTRLALAVHRVATLLCFALLYAAFAVAAQTQTPPGCSGIALWTGFYTDTQACSPGDVIHYGITVANDRTYNPIDCDVTGLAVTITTPDYMTHAVPLTRTTLTSGQWDDYPNAVSYVVSATDVRQDGTVKASVLVTDSQCSTNWQGVNAKVILPTPPAALVPAITALTTNVASLQTNVSSINAILKRNRLK
jgi:hypothetical protein